MNSIIWPDQIKMEKGGARGELISLWTNKKLGSISAL